MFFPDEVERAILHRSTSKTPYNNQPLIKKAIYERKVGGSHTGVKVLHSSSMSGGSNKRNPTVWQTLIKNTMKDNGLSMKDAIKHIKDIKLYL